MCLSQVWMNCRHSYLLCRDPSSSSWISLSQREGPALLPLPHQEGTDVWWGWWHLWLSKAQPEAAAPGSWRQAADPGTTQRHWGCARLERGARPAPALFRSDNNAVRRLSLQLRAPAFPFSCSLFYQNKLISLSNKCEPRSPQGEKAVGKSSGRGNSAHSKKNPVGQFNCGISIIHARCA